MATPPKAIVTPVPGCDIQMRAWEKIQEKQIHLDTMMMQMRAMVLSAFIIVIGAIFTLAQLNKEAFDKGHGYWLMVVPIALWAAAFLIDYFYYFKLLCGAVKSGKQMRGRLHSQGIEFEDVNDDLSDGVAVGSAHLLIILFYLMPAFAAFALVMSAK